MKIVRYESLGGTVRHGHLDAAGEICELDGDAFGPHMASARRAEVARLLCPVAPPAIFCIGLNYRRHAVETGAKISEFPVLFMKSPAAATGPGSNIELPASSAQVDYEGELVVIIGRTAKNVRWEDAGHYILGYTIGNDVSARDWQKQWGGGQFCRGKTFDTFAPMGPYIVTPDEIPDPSKLKIVTRLNGDVMQRGEVSDLIFDVPRLIEFLSDSTTLLPGTAIFTGTPAGVGAARTPPVFLKPGDQVEIEIDGIGLLANSVVSAAMASTAR